MHHRVSAAGAVIAAILLAAIVASVVSYGVVVRGFTRYDQVSRMLRTSHDVLYDLLNQQSNAYGYNSTRDPYFLRTYGQAIGQTHKDLNDLDRQSEGLQLAAIDSSVKRLLDLNGEWKKTTASLLKKNRPEETARLQDYDKELMDNMRYRVSLITDETQALQSAIVGDARKTIVLGAVGLLASILILGVIGLTAERTLRYQQHLLVQEREAELKRVSTIAFYDHLTQLQNRASFMLSFEQIIERSQRHSQCIACLFVDLDGFKAVNDSLGHEAGDRVLQSVAKVLRNAVRRSDIVGRIGGDEFVIAVSITTMPADAELVATKILGAIRQEIDIDGTVKARVSASIGISFFPEDGKDAETLIRLADGAMYAAKKGGKNRYALCHVEAAVPGDRPGA
jgi:diguanylate cyclase (GGDEF)-like protein